MYIEKDSGNNFNLEISLGIGLGIAVIVVGYLLFKKASSPKTKVDKGIDDDAKHAIDYFINSIISDYYNEYRINYISVTYNLKELETKTSYVFKTKRIGSLSNIVDFSQVSSGEKYLKKLIEKKYNILLSTDNILLFIIEVSRIEGKIKAVESVKMQIPEDDYSKLIGELEEDIIYYKKKYSTTI